MACRACEVAESAVASWKVQQLQTYISDYGVSLGTLILLLSPDMSIKLGGCVVPVTKGVTAWYTPKPSLP